MARQWHETGMYWETRPPKAKGKPAAPWTREERPTPKNTLTEELFSAVLMKLSKINYNEVTLDQAKLDEEIQKGTKGANDLREEDEYSPEESPIVYVRETKRNKQKIKKIILRKINPTRKNNLYLTFIHKELWEYDKGAVERMITQYKTEMVNRGYFGKFGWKSEPPPRVPRKDQMNMEQYLQHLKGLLDKEDPKDKKK